MRSDVILLSYPRSTNPSYGSLYPQSCSFRRPLFIHSYIILSTLLPIYLPVSAPTNISSRLLAL